MVKKKIIVFFLIFIICGCTDKGMEKDVKIEKINCSEAESLIAEGATLIDVRSAIEFEEAHLDGAVNIEYGAINSIISGIVSDKNAKIIVYCQSGRRSEIAATTLVNMGYTNVYDLGSIENCM